jgi:hypothetical protein
MAEVISLRGEALPGEPDSGIVEELERLLVDAKAGKLRGIAYATCLDTGGQGTGWSGVAGSRHPLGTAIMMLHHRYARGLLEG